MLEIGSYAQGQSGQTVYVSQPGHSYVQQQQPVVTSFQTNQSAAAKYSAASQSPFSSYSTHYATHQQGVSQANKALSDGFPSGYAVQRMQQPGRTLL